MNGVRRVPRVGRLLLAVLVACLALAAAGSAPGATTAAALSRWTGGIDLYQTGVFTTQKSWLWCTAADVQIIRNIVDRATDHARASQERYFDAMRAHDRYDIPITDGVDPAGWAYGLRHFVDSRYRLVASGSFDAALRSAVANLRRTNLPVGITVARGNHAWILTGFTATADPAATTHYSVTSVRVVGPLWGLQSRSYGYDMRPDTKLTPRQLAGFFTPWHYAGVRMAWEGDWVSIQPIAVGTAAIGIAAVGPAATTRPKPAPASPPTASAVTASPIESPGALASVDPTPGAVALAASGRPSATGDVDGALPIGAAGASTEGPSPGWLAAGLVVVLAIAIAIAGAGVRRRNVGRGSAAR
jgi:hypothetical protein